jgi:hypothetical protein
MVGLEGPRSLLGVMATVKGQFMVMVSFDRPAKETTHSQGVGAIVAVTPSSFWRPEFLNKITVPFKIETGVMGTQYFAMVSRKEFSDVFGLMDAVAQDRNGVLLFRFAGAEDRFVSATGQDKLKVARDCVNQLVGKL